MNEFKRIEIVKFEDGVTVRLIGVKQVDSVYLHGIPTNITVALADALYTSAAENDDVTMDLWNKDMERKEHD